MLAGVWAAIKILGIWKRVASILGATASWVFKNPWIAAAILIGIVEELERHEISRIDKRYADRVAADAVAQKVAGAKLVAQIALSAKNAQEAQTHEQLDIAAATAASAGYKATHSVQYVFRNSAAILPTANGASVPVVAPTSAVVLTNTDFDKCGADYAYALSAYRWAQTLKP